IERYKKNNKLSNEHAISIRNDQDFSTFEHEIQMDFSFINSICGQYVFTPKQRLWVNKKALNMTIETGYTEELYELHQQFIADMKKQLADKKMSHN
ncbi:23790_t:CDS:2, partial [Gigaspora margarita]